MPATFKRDAEVAKMATDYTINAANVAKRKFGVVLDGSDASIAAVEQILGKLQTQSAITAQKPSQPMLWTYAKLFGSYVGEVLRARHGGEWGLSVDGVEERYALERNGEILWPHTQVYDRLNGDEANDVWRWYREITRT